MVRWLSIFFCPLVASALLFEGYWESYNEFPNDLEACRLKEGTGVEPVSPDFVASLETAGKLDVVTIAFADLDLERCERGFGCRQFVCGLNLFQGLDDLRFEAFKAKIKALQGQGTKVKLAFGGETFGNIRVPFGITNVADRMVEVVVDAVQALGVDGIDLVQKEGCGSRNLRCMDSTAVHLYLVEELRRLLPTNTTMGYTFPSGHFRLNYPFLNVVKYGHQYLDSLTFFGSSTSRQIQQALDETSVPRSKV